MKNEIILYRSNELAEHIEVRFDEDTVWLTQAQIARLFGRSKQNISLHINNVFTEGELAPNAVVKDYLTTAKDGKNYHIKYYNLDIIISVGYRVKSQQGTQFRIWAINKLRDYLLKGYVVNTRMDRIEDNVDALKNKVEEIDLQIKAKQIPNQGVFFEGQVFDAYELASKIIRSAIQSIVLIDNYIDETALTHLAKKNNGVKVLLLTKRISKRLSLDVKKADVQYGDFNVKQFTHSHDRFIIIDGGKEVYHLGASLKDLGRKWFAFQKMDKDSVAGIIAAISGLA